MFTRTSMIADEHCQGAMLTLENRSIAKDK
jgi:hypothetical protein